MLALVSTFLAYSNGANDDFKGVATLYGSKVLSFQNARNLGIITTFAGSILSYVLAEKLLRLFSGKGLVAAFVLQDPKFLISVALGAAATVFLATLLGFPISTTHGLVGGLLGAGIASGGLLSFWSLGSSFLLPLILGPVIGLTLTWMLYQILHSVRKKSGIESSYCLCIGARRDALIGSPGLLTIRSTGLQITVEEEQYCRSIYPGTLAGINVQKIMDGFHILSASAVSLARGLNDSPKIAALLLAVPFLQAKTGLLLVAVAMAIGGALHSRKIAQKMSVEITEMNPGQAFTANLVTAVLVIAGSIFGFPLSTTHVSCSSIFAIGFLHGNARTRTILQILAAWIITLPLATVLSAIFWFVL